MYPPESAVAFNLMCVISSHPFHTITSRQHNHEMLLSNTGQVTVSPAVLLQAWSGPEGFRKLRFPDFMTTAQDGGKVVSLTHRPPLPSGNTPGTHFC